MSKGIYELNNYNIKRSSFFIKNMLGDILDRIFLTVLTILFILFCQNHLYLKMRRKT